MRTPKIALTLLASFAPIASPALALCPAAPATQSVPIKTEQHPVVRLVTALDGDAAARDFDAVMQRSGGIFVDKTKLAMTLVAIRMTEQGSLGQEYGILLEDSTYKAQAQACAEFVIAGYMSWIGPNNRSKVEDPQDWHAYLPFLGRFYSKARPWSLLKTKVEGPVTTDREPAEVQAWVQSVRFFYDLQVRRMRDHRGSKKAPLVQGLPDGFQTIEEEGRKVAEGLVEDGHMQGPWVFFHKNGKKSLEGTFKNSRWEGEVRAWHINGNRKSVMEYEGGEPHGPARTYYGNGKPSSSGRNERGQRTGEWEEFDYGGQPKGTVTYKNGRKVRSR